MFRFKKLDNRGSVSPLILVSVALGVLLLGSLIFGFGQMGKVGDYKTNMQSKVDEEVKKQSDLIAQNKQAEFDEKEKAPYKFWTSPTQYGSIRIGFPKTWSSYINLDTSSSAGSRSSIDFYAHPDYVPATNTKDQRYALRMTLQNDDYNKILDGYRRDSSKNGTKISTIQNSGVSGIKVEGLIDNKVTGTVAIFQIREKVLTIWTESVDYQPDFENIVLKNLSFIP